MMGAPLLTSSSNKQVIAVDIADLRVRADRMDTRAREAKIEVDKLVEEVMGLVERWKGPNRDRFAEYISYNTGFMAVQAYADYLARYAEALHKVVKIYERLQANIDGVVLGRPTSESRGASQGTRGHQYG